MKRILLLASAVAFLPMMALAVSFNHNLSPGTSGADVIHLQQFLVSEGMYSGPITGMFGPLTKKALIAFQEKEGISPTGYFGPLTQAAANAAISSLSLPPVSLYSTSPILVVSEPTSLSATSSYAQKFIDGTSLDTAIDSYGYIDVSFDTVLTYEQWIESFHWTIPNQFIFGGDPSLPQIKTSFQCIPGPTHDIQALGFGGLVFPANGNYQCQMIITDINGNVSAASFNTSPTSANAGASYIITEKGANLSTLSGNIFVTS